MTKRFFLTLAAMALVATAAFAALPPFRPVPLGSPCSGFDYNWVQFEESCDTNGDGVYSANEVCRSNCRANRAICDANCKGDSSCELGCLSAETTCNQNCPAA